MPEFQVSFWWLNDLSCQHTKNIKNLEDTKDQISVKQIHMKYLLCDQHCDNYCGVLKYKGNFWPKELMTYELASRSKVKN
jgi:hypothetical protein